MSAAAAAAGHAEPGAETPRLEAPSSSVAPERVDVDPRGLALRWPDGLEARLDAGPLRHACRCGDCRREPPGPAAQAGRRIVEASPVGGYGLQLAFDDGHDRGIYPWAYLRALAGNRTEPAP